MVLEAERAALIEKIEMVFADRLSGKELAKFLKEMALVDSRFGQMHGYYLDEVEKYFRGHTWIEMSSADGIIYRFTDIDNLDEISDDALAYYLPAFLVALLHKPWDLVYSILWVERIVAILSKLRSDQLDLLLEYSEFMVRYYETQMRESSTRFDELHMQDFEEIGLRVLMYRDEMGSLLKRREEQQPKDTNTSG